MTTQPPDFDWVTARSKCTATEMYEVLRAAARANTVTRNAIRDESDDADRFRFKDRQPRGFTIWDTWSGKRQAVDVDLQENVIRIALEHHGVVRENLVTLTLNDEGLCKFKIGADELDQWQVLKRVLEPLFFS